jgi:hypothetical protein
MPGNLRRTQNPFYRYISPSRVGIALIPLPEAVAFSVSVWCKIKWQKYPGGIRRYRGGPWHAISRTGIGRATVKNARRKSLNKAPQRYMMARL